MSSWFGWGTKNDDQRDQNDSVTGAAEATPLLASPSIATPSASKQNVDKALIAGDPASNEKKNISLAQLRPFLEIAIPFFREDRAAFCSLIGIVILTLLESALLILFSYTRRDIFDALNNKQEEAFFRDILYFFGVLVLIVPVAVFYEYLLRKLALYWRKELTKRVLDKYYANRTYYIIECCKDIDNPDQRISEDLTEFTSTSLDFFFIVFDAVVNLVSFSAVLYNIYPMLFVAIIGYAVIGTFLTARLGRTLVGQYYKKLQREADFRFGLIRTRENAEGIAFYDSEAKLEQINLWTLFERVVSNQLGIIKTQRNLELFTTSYDYLVFVIPYLVVAPLYFRGEIDLGSITQASEAFYYVRSDFSIIVSYFEKLSAFSAGINRLSTFIRRINQGGWAALKEEDDDVDGNSGRSNGTGSSNDGGALKGLSNDSGDVSHIGELGKSKGNGAGRVLGKIQMYCVPREDASMNDTDPAGNDNGGGGGNGDGGDDGWANRPVGLLRATHSGKGSDKDKGSDKGSEKDKDKGEVVVVSSSSGTKASTETTKASTGTRARSTGPVVLRCTDLTVLTPDGYRTLIGAVKIGDIIGNPGDARTATKPTNGVNFSIWEGDRVLVTGPSGTGKSSLLRAISGLWELGSGRIVWNTGKNPSALHTTNNNSNNSNESNSNATAAVVLVPASGCANMNAPEGVFFLPQKPYNLLGSLRQQIAYPSIIPGDFQEDQEGDGLNIVVSPLATISTDLGLIDGKNTASTGDSNGSAGGGTAMAGLDLDMELLDILSRVRLETLASRMGSGDERAGLGVYKDWTKVLSLGEQQRLAFARLLYNSKLGRISVAVLDEATSALDEASEAAMYHLLDEMGTHSRLTYISVGHRSSLHKFHSKKLVLLGPGLEVDCVPI